MSNVAYLTSIVGRPLRDVGGTQAALVQYPRFIMSDSRAAARMFLGRVRNEVLHGLLVQTPDRAGSNNRNTYWVREAGAVACQASSLKKANGAGHADGPSGADSRLTGISGLPEVYLE